MSRDVVARARAGDHAAFAVLAEGLIDRLYRIARNVLRDAALAEDVVQETLLEAWRSLPGLRDDDRFEAWTHRILMRSCIRAGSHRGRRSVIEIHVDDLDAVAPGREHGTVDLRDELERGFARIDVQKRALLVMHYALGFTAEEIGDLIGIPAATVRTRMHRAVREMRSALEADARTTTLRHGETE